MIQIARSPDCNGSASMVSIDSVPRSYPAFINCCHFIKRPLSHGGAVLLAILHVGAAEKFEVVLSRSPEQGVRYALEKRIEHTQASISDGPGVFQTNFNQHLLRFVSEFELSRFRNPSNYVLLHDVQSFTREAGTNQFELLKPQTLTVHVWNG